MARATKRAPRAAPDPKPDTAGAGSPVGAPLPAAMAPSIAEQAAANTGTTPGLASALSIIPTRTTVPDEIVRHSISDEQLTMLSTPHLDALRDTLRDVLLCAVGVFLGSIQALYNRIASMLGGTSGPLTGGQIIEIGLPIASLATIVILGILLATSKRSHPAIDLAKEIRERTKSLQG